MGWLAKKAHVDDRRWCSSLGHRQSLRLKSKYEGLTMACLLAPIHPSTGRSRRIWRNHHSLALDNNTIQRRPFFEPCKSILFSFHAATYRQKWPFALPSFSPTSDLHSADRPLHLLVPEQFESPNYILVTMPRALLPDRLLTPIHQRLYGRKNIVRCPAKKRSA